MNNSIKNYIGIAGIITLIALSYAGIKFGNSSDTQPYRTFSVQAEGEVIAVPDVARFTFSVLTEGGTDLSSIQEENATRANLAIDFLKENNIDEKDIKTSGYSVSPRYQYYDCTNRLNGAGATPCPPAEIVGYSVVERITVTIRDVAQAGALVAGVVENGVNTVSGISFEIDDPTELQNQAREKALTKTREKARAIAKAGDFRLGKIVSVNENFYSPSVYGRDASFALAESAPTPTAPKIEPGSEKVTVTMYIVYEIK